MNPSYNAPIDTAEQIVKSKKVILIKIYCQFSYKHYKVIIMNIGDVETVEKEDDTKTIITFI